MNDGLEVVKLLNKIMKSLAKKYNLSDTDVGMFRYANGVILLKVGDIKDYYFFDERDFADWIKEMAQEIH